MKLLAVVAVIFLAGLGGVGSLTALATCCPPAAVLAGPASSAFLSELAAAAPADIEPAWSGSPPGRS